MGSFYKKVREISQDLIQLLEDLSDESLDPDPLYGNIIEDHQEILRGISSVSIIDAAYSKSYRFLQVQGEIFKKKNSHSNAMICKVMADRVHDIVIESLKETQPITVQVPDKKS